MAGRLKDKVALITGGGSGIGQGIAKIFAREGAKVVITGRTPEKLQETLQQIEADGGQAIAVSGDVSKAQDVEKMVEQTVAEFGKLNVLINNAGVGGAAETAVDMTEEQWYHLFDIDAKGSWLCSKYAIPEMKKCGGGSIIMISSISAYFAQHKQGPYNAAKAAQELLMKCMALDFAPDNIRANSICPAWVITKANAGLIDKWKSQPDKVFPEFNMSYNYMTQVLHPIGRLGTPEDCAWAAVYLASDESTWVTGSSLMIDGGYTCQ